MYLYYVISFDYKEYKVSEQLLKKEIEERTLFVGLSIRGLLIRV